MKNEQVMTLTEHAMPTKEEGITFSEHVIRMNEKSKH